MRKVRSTQGITTPDAEREEKNQRNVGLPGASRGGSLESNVASVSVRPLAGVRDGFKVQSLIEVKLEDSPSSPPCCGPVRRTPGPAMPSATTVGPRSASFARPRFRESSPRNRHSFSRFLRESRFGAERIKNRLPTTQDRSEPKP